LAALSLKNYTTSENRINSSVRRHKPEEDKKSDHLPQKISSDFRNESIYVDRYVKEASNELALSYRLRAISTIKPASRV
jgi:hypothetical protein